MLSLPSSSSSSSSSRKKYDVFLSFSGKDTRNNFTDHLYAALKRNGIGTFRDDSKLEAGEEIAPELFKAIQESWCSVIVFSETYAFSRWCLAELSEIVEQRKQRGHKIFPIFYNVDPSDLRYQNGKVKEAFAKHENKDKTQSQRWRTALTEVANLKGWHLNNSPESEFIEDIVTKILAKIWIAYPIVVDGLIGINSQLEKLYLKIGIGNGGVRIIGICGMGGIGKTTLARVVFNQMSRHFVGTSIHFEGTCFLPDVREESKKCGLVSLQTELLSQIFLQKDFNLKEVYEGKDIIKNRLCCKKVLVVIDNADNSEHLECLVGSRDWFGSGSRIIITTRDEQVLKLCDVDDVYKPTTMNYNDALALFNLKAFRSDQVPKNEFIELSERVIHYADGLPLALKVLGSSLRGKDATTWRSAIERLKREPDRKIFDVLQMSFDGLNETEKNIFLDIACFFNRMPKDLVIKVLDGCGFFPHIGIDDLIQKSLMEVNELNELWMHDLLLEMGRNIVRQKSPNELGKRCRLWKEEEVDHVLMNNTATESIESMIVNLIFTRIKDMALLTDAFLKMKKLRLLSVSSCSNDFPSNDFYLSNELRFLKWFQYPFKSLPSSFEPGNLVVLLLPYSCIEQLWEGKRHLNRLKMVNLIYCQNLIKTPDFGLAPKIESLILEGCTRLKEVHPSVGVLRELKLLNLKGCESLRSLPTMIGMESLERLILTDCSSLQRFPEIDGKMKCLWTLDLERTGIEELPSSIGHLSSLEVLILSGCSNLKRFPEIDGEMECLLELYLDGTGIEDLPSSIGHLNNLASLDLKDCNNLVSLPRNINGLKCLETLDISGCNKVKEDLSGFKESIALMLPLLSGLSSLANLNLSDCNLVEGDIPSDICCLSSLTELDLSGNNFISLPETLGLLPMLRKLHLLDCRMLKSLPGLLTGIEQVNIDGCVSLEVLVDPTTVYKKRLNIDGCASLEVVVDPTTVYKKGFDVTIRGINCFKLAERDNALTFLKKHLKIHAEAIGCFSLLVPGIKIPEWFSHQTDETSIQIPENGFPWFEESGVSIKIPLSCPWVGVAFCCVFDCDVDLRWSGTVLSLFDICIHDVYRFHAYIDLAGKDGRQGFQRFDNHYRWLCYWTRNELYNSKLNGEHVCDEIFECRMEGDPFIEVKMCGLRLVYEKDLEEMEEIEEHSSSPASAKFDNHGVTGNGGALVKRKRNICEEAGSSESEC